MSKPEKAAPKRPTPARGTKLMLSVGLVNVPVKLAPLVKETSKIRGSYVCPDHLVPAKMGAKVCEHDGHEVEEPVIAFQYEGRYVTGVDRSDHRASGDGIIALGNVIELSEVDPLYFEKTYLMWPQDGAQAGYDLLAEALRRSGLALIGETVMTTSTRALAIRWSNATGTLVAHVLAVDAGIAWNDCRLVAAAIAPVDEEHLQLADALLRSLDGDFDFTDLTDDYQESLAAAIAAAAEGLPVPVVEAEKPKAATADLMAALTASVVSAQPSKPKAKPRKKAA